MKKLKDYKGCKVYRVDKMVKDCFGREIVYPAYLVEHQGLLKYKTSYLKDAHRYIDSIVSR